MTSQRLSQGLLAAGGVLALVGISITLLAPLRDGRIDWLGVAIPLVVIANVAANLLQNKLGRLRTIVPAVSLALALATLVWAVLRLTHHVA